MNVNLLSMGYGPKQIQLQQHQNQNKKYAKIHILRKLRIMQNSNTNCTFVLINLRNFFISSSNPYHFHLGI